jgi:hypothetical protein
LNPPFESHFAVTRSTWADLTLMQPGQALHVRFKLDRKSAPGRYLNCESVGKIRPKAGFAKEHPYPVVRLI